MLQISNLLAAENGVLLLALACVAGTASMAAALALLARARAARGLARFAWLGGVAVVLACGTAAIWFTMIGVHGTVPTVPRRAVMITVIALIIMGTSIAAALVDRRLAEKNALIVTALNNMNHGLMMFDTNSRVILCNQRYLELYRLPPDAIRPGMTLREVLEIRVANGAFTLDPDEYCREVLGCFARGEPSRKIIEMKDGRTVVVVGEPLATGGWVATHQDVTAERQRESSFRFLFDNNPLPMWVWDHETLGFLAVNKAAVEKYGYDRERFLTLTLRDIKRTSDWSSIEGAARGDDRGLREGRASIHARADGSLFEVEFYGRSMTYEGRPASVVALIDVTDRKRTEEELRRTREFFNTILENVPPAIAVKNTSDGKYIFINRAAEKQFGLKRNQVLGKTAEEVFPNEAAKIIVARDRDLVESGGERFYDTHVMASNDHNYITSRRVLVRDERKQPRYILNVVEDVTERKHRDDELRRTRAFLDTIIENMPVALTVKNIGDKRYVLANRAAEQAFGVPDGAMIGKRADEIFTRETADFIDASDREVASSGALHVAEEQPFETPEGTRLLNTKKLPVRGEDSEAQYLLSLSEDVTDRKRARDQIAHMALHDPLTDLPNRAAFNEQLGVTLDSAGNAARMFAVLSIDVDRFKQLNDVFGHAAGDKLLCAVANRLNEAAPGTYLARLGGDEFAMIVTEGAQPATAEAIAEKLLAAMAVEFSCGTERVHIGLSIGVAVYPSDGKDTTSLLANANAALYRAKSGGRGAIRFFEAHMDERVRDQRALQHELRAAVENRELVLHYQPQARIGGEIIGFEALVRWHHPNRGVIPPSVFIPLAEECGLVVPMSEWILREACREAASWPKPLQIAVNLSPVQFHDDDLPATVHAILLETGLAPDRLELEVTEGVLINDFARAVSILRRLKLLGVQIAMDDFGTGYSSLSYLQSFPFDKIKIDRTFIANLTDNHYSATIVRAVIGLGRGLGLPIMAEGVETAEQIAFLARESCDEVQGYFIGRPAAIETYADLVGRKTAPMLKLVSG